MPRNPESWLFPSLTALAAHPSGGLLSDDVALSIDSSNRYWFIYDSTSGAAHSSPDVIKPDDAGATGRWLKKEASDDVFEIENNLSEGVAATMRTNLAFGDWMTTDYANWDGDKLVVDYAAGHGGYTRTTTPSEVTSLTHLTAHLAGIDAEL